MKQIESWMGIGFSNAAHKVIENKKKQPHQAHTTTNQTKWKIYSKCFTKKQKKIVINDK